LMWTAGSKCRHVFCGEVLNYTSGSGINQIRILILLYYSSFLIKVELYYLEAGRVYKNEAYQNLY
jgi:hypothetical protein